MDMFGFSDQDIEVIKGPRKPREAYQQILFKPNVDVAFIIKESSEGVQTASNGNHYLKLALEVHHSSVEHPGETLTHMVWEKSKFPSESLEDFQKRECPLKMLLGGIFTAAELKEGRWKDGLTLVQRLPGTVIKLTPGKKTVDQETDIMKQNLNYLEVITPAVPLHQ